MNAVTFAEVLLFIAYQSAVGPLLGPIGPDARRPVNRRK